MITSPDKSSASTAAEAFDIEKGIRMNIDIENIFELDRLNMEEFFNDSAVPFDPEMRRAGLLKEIGNGAIFITVKREGSLVGYIEYVVEDNGNAYVPSVQVHPKYKRRFVLRGMFSKAYHVLKDNFPAMIRSSVHRDNKLSLKLHGRLGFKKADDTPERVHFTINGKELVNRLVLYDRHRES
jgi:ribosomal protein S18 acetylase RimI-like enzyme